VISPFCQSSALIAIVKKLHIRRHLSNVHGRLSIGCFLKHAATKLESTVSEIEKYSMYE